MDDLLVQTMIVYRRQTPGGTVKKDRFGQPTEDEVEPTGGLRYPCRIRIPKGGERFTDRTRDVVEDKTTAYVPIGSDVRETDVATILAPDGETELVMRGEISHVEIVFDGAGLEHHRQVQIGAQRQSS